MTKMPADDRKHADGMTESMKRRGLLAAAWAAMAAVVLNRTTQPVEAGVDGDVVLGAQNTTTGDTIITCSTPNGAGLGGFCITGLDGWGLAGQGSAYGVLGSNTADGKVGGAGVFGLSIRSDSYGVWGENIAPSGTAVFGLSVSGNGVLGQIPVSSFDNGIAVYGANLASYAGPGPGAGGFGVYGLSAKGHGLVGATATAGGAAVVGAVNGVAGAYAGAFYGPVVVSGALTVFGAKSAAVPHPDGSHRRLYCMESPESWFEDFGHAQLDCGRAEVAIDPDFAAVVNMDNYQVFLTEYGTHNALYVADRTATGFHLQAAKDGADTGAFGWRVVAKRKDIPAPRFETVSVPPEPVLPSIPEPIVPQLPQFPDMGQQRTRARR
jgi:hypothetical protein